VKDLQKYRESDLSDEELEVITGRLLRAKDDHERQQRWAERLSKEKQINRQPAPKAKLRWLPLWIAAAVILFVTIFLLREPAPTYQSLVDNYITADFYENRDRLKGDQDVDQSNIRAVDAYNRQDFDTAINHYENIIKTGTATDEQYFFLGLSQLYSNRYAKAAQQFEKVLQVNRQSKFEQETHWFLALSYLKVGNTGNGKEKLQLINAGEWRYTDAQKLLKLLGDDAQKSPE